MAHALGRAGQEPDGIVSRNGTTITIHSSATVYWQSWENGGDKSTYRVDLVIGSGEHANGYLVDNGGHLFQSSVAFYKSRHAYDLAPGYENQPDPDFTRPVSEECFAIPEWHCMFRERYISIGRRYSLPKPLPASGATARQRSIWRIRAQGQS